MSGDKYQLQHAADLWHRCPPAARAAVMRHVENLAEHYDQEDLKDAHVQDTLKALAALCSLARFAIPAGSR